MYLEMIEEFKIKLIKNYEPERKPLYCFKIGD